MPDYIYLLENRLSPAQQSALQTIREAAREAGMTVFLTGGAVRDLTSGSPVRDIDVSVQGNALDLKKQLKEAGAVLWGEHTPSQTFFARFPGSVRVEISSTRREEFPKPGKPVYHPGSILEDLRRRDFTANAMALSLNEGSYGLLMDPLNGVADLEARLLRLVSNYGFLEDPIRMIRAARLQARLGWELEEKTLVRFQNAKEEGVLSHISDYQLGYEVEEILHEEDALKILKALEADGSMKTLFPAWTSAKVDLEALDQLREVLVQLQMQGVNPDPSAAQAQLLTAKLPAKDLVGLKKMFVRQGFVHEWETQEERAKEIGKQLTGKDAATPSAAWKLLTSADPEAVLWLGLTSKSAPVQAKFKDFFTVWPEARQRIPYALMQEMRIVPELEGYQSLLKSMFFELIDGKLTTDEEMRAFLEPHSPPAPPPPVSIRRTRAKKSAEKAREVRDTDDDDSPEVRPGRDDEDSDDEDEDSDGDQDRDHDHEPEEVTVRPSRQSAPKPVPAAPVVVPSPTPAPIPVVVSAEVPAKAAQMAEVKAKAKPALEVVPKAPVKAVGTVAAKAVVKPVSKAPAKTASKAGPSKPVAKTVPKPVAKKSAKKAAKHAAKPVAKKMVVKSAVKTKPTAKSLIKAKAPLKKAAVKTTAKSKLRKSTAKPKTAKAIVKARPTIAKAKPAVKSKAPVKNAKASVKVSAKGHAKPVAKVVPAKKKKR